MPPRPFRLGTTSFILPDHIIPNVIKLGTVFDEIELLVFESYPLDVLPSKADVKTLLSLSGDLNLTYNVHLPTDVSLSSESSPKRQAAADTLLRVMDRFDPLAPSTHTLHLEMPPGVRRDMGNPEKIRDWLNTTREGLAAFLSRLPDPSIISVETLDYPLLHIEPLIREFHLSVCVDAGHQIRWGHDLLQAFEAHRSRIPLIHLHGVDRSGPEIKDHKALDHLSREEILKVLRVLENFRGTISLEVFNLENLNRSLRVLSRYFKDLPSEIR
nr:sugar phosphate isomerase/epimerase [Desulfobacula sp.]